MKRFVCLCLALLLLVLPCAFAYASFASPIVSRLNLVGATVGATGGINVAAKVTGVTSGGANVASWISLLIPGSNVAKIAVAAAAVGGALASDYLMAKGAAWWASKGISHNGDGTYDITETKAIPNGHVPGDYTGPNGATGQGMGIWGVQQTAFDLANAYYNGHKGDGALWGGHVGASSTGMGAAAYTVNYKGKIYYWYYSPTLGTYNADVARGLPSSELENLLALDLAADNSNAKILGLAGIEVAAAALDNPNHPVNSNSTQKAAIAAALANSISAGQLTNLEAAATPNVGDNVLPDDSPNVNDLTPAQIADAVRVALEGQGLNATQIAAAIAAAQAAAAQGLTQAEAQAAVAAALSAAGVTGAGIQSAVSAALTAAGLATNAGVQTAVKNAIDDETGITPPTDPTPLVPDKLSLTAVLTSFVASIQALPMFQTLNGLTINCSGSSTLCLAVLGASYCYDASGMTGALNMIGSALLGLTTIFSFLGIFKS